MSEQIKVPKADEVETLLVIKQAKLKPVGSNEVKRYVPGQKLQMVGLDKLDALGQGVVTRDLKANVPENTKRHAPDPAQVEFTQNPQKVLAEALNRLSDVLEALEKKIK